MEQGKNVKNLKWVNHLILDLSFFLNANSTAS